MTAFEAAGLYTGLCVLLFAVLKLNVGRVRSPSGISVGHGENAALQNAMRIQANAVEDTPIALLGLFALAALSAPITLIHVLGGGLVLGRVLHALGMGGAPGFGFGRLVGTLLSLLVLLVTAATLIWIAVS